MADEPHIFLKGQIGCGWWTAQRNIHQAQPLENWVMGYLDGLSIARKTSFWKEGDADNDAVYSGIDAYCRANVTKTILDGADLIYSQRQGPKLN